MLTISQGLHNPDNLVLDASNNLYVSNFNGVCKGPRSGNVSVFAPGTTSTGDDDR